MKRKILSALLAFTFLLTSPLAARAQGQAGSRENDLQVAVRAKVQNALDSNSVCKTVALETSSEDCPLPAEEDEDANESDVIGVGAGDFSEGALAAADAIVAVPADPATTATTAPAEPSVFKHDMEEHIKTKNASVSEGNDERALWEIKRYELEQWVRESYWITWKLMSRGDSAMAVELTTVGFKIPKLIALAFGLGGILDAVEDRMEEWFHQGSWGELDSIRREARLNVLYVRIQRNAFNLIYADKDAYFELIKEYPEVEYLFNDLYTFFKWRSHLHEFYKDQEKNPYQYNDYLLYKVFKKATQRNSFEGWWELANVAKKEMRAAMAENKNCLTSSKSAKKEATDINRYVYDASNALEAGRKWNGIQRYAVRKHALPRSLYPRLGAGTIQMRKEIRAKLEGKTIEGLQKEFTDYRLVYLKGRIKAEEEWNKFYAENDLGSRHCVSSSEEEEAIAEELEKLTDPIAEDFSLADNIADWLNQSVE